jgi:predicted  nucleic acid-binding Zn-ribbon protein
MRMDSRSPTIIISGLLLLAGCATSPDPAKGGFISGLNGLVSGGYNRRIAEQSSELDQMRAQQAAAEAESTRANAALGQRQQSVAAMRVSIGKLDGSVKSMQAKLAQQRASTKELSAHDAQLTQELEDAERRVAKLRSQVGGGGMPPDYDATQREYQSLQTAIAALHEQLDGERQ